MKTQKILFDETAIAQRVAELGAEISAFYAGKPLTVVTLMNGAMLFASDLVRKISNVPDLYLDSLSVSSYQNDVSSGELTIRSGLKLPVCGRHVLLLDDILDTGFTLKKTMQYLSGLGAASVRSCVLLKKETARRTEHISADWTGFTLPDHYVIGYGLDSHELYRGLPDIRVIVTEGDA